MNLTISEEGSRVVAVLSTSTLAQAGGRDPNRLDEALATVPAVVGELLSSEAGL